jgi:hypothetical protein
MRRRSAHYSRALQAALVLSLASGLVLGVYELTRPRTMDHDITLAIAELRARAAELVELARAAHLDHATGPFLHGHLTQWRKATLDADRTLAHALPDDPSGHAAAAIDQARALIALASRLDAAPGTADSDIEFAANRSTEALRELERARRI